MGASPGVTKPGRPTRRIRESCPNEQSPKEFCRSTAAHRSAHNEAHRGAQRGAPRFRRTKGDRRTAPTKRSRCSDSKERRHNAFRRPGMTHRGVPIVARRRTEAPTVYRNGAEIGPARSAHPRRNEPAPISELWQSSGVASKGRGAPRRTDTGGQGARRRTDGRTAAAPSPSIAGRAAPTDPGVATIPGSPDRAPPESAGAPFGRGDRLTGDSAGVCWKLCRVG